MLGNAGETQFDLRFRLFGIPIRVHPLFWLISALVTWIPNRPELVLVGILCFFLTVLVHELGHALVFRRYVFSAWNCTGSFTPSIPEYRVRRFLAGTLAQPAGSGIDGCVLSDSTVLFCSGRLNIRAFAEDSDSDCDLCPCLLGDSPDDRTGPRTPAEGTVWSLAKPLLLVKRHDVLYAEQTKEDHQELLSVLCSPQRDGPG